MDGTMKPERCPCCQQIIPPARIFETAPVKQRIYEFIARHPEGVTRDQILGSVWADDIDGGPEFGNIVSVHVEKMRPVLKRHGLTITAARSGRGGGGRYRLVEAAE
jgi:DNA-binding response OmpR family regulator